MLTGYGSHHEIAAVTRLDVYDYPRFHDRTSSTSSKDDGGDTIVEV